MAEEYVKISGKSLASLIDEGALKHFGIFAAILALGAITDAYNQFVVTSSTFSLIPYFHYHGVTVLTVSLSIYFIGSFIGAISWGVVADRIGRKLTFVIDLLIMALMAVVSSFSTNVFELWSIRFIMGIAAGGDYAAALALLVEFSPRKKRGVMLGTFWAMFNVGGVAAALVGYALFLSYGNSGLQWQLLYASGAIPAIIGIFLRLKLPESARWLHARGKNDKAKDALEQIVGRPLKDGEIDWTEISKSDKSSHVSQMFSRRYMLATIALPIAIILPNYLLVTNVSELPLVLRTLHYGAGLSLLIDAFAFFLPLAISNFFVALINDKIGRLPVYFFGSAIGAGVMGFVLAVTFKSIDLLIGTIVVIGLLTPFYTTVAASWGAELYPTRFRSTGAGYGIFLWRLGSASGIFLTPFLISSVGVSSTFNLYGILGVLGFLITWGLLHKYGKTENKTLEEITDARV